MTHAEMAAGKALYYANLVHKALVAQTVTYRDDPKLRIFAPAILMIESRHLQKPILASTCDSPVVARWMMESGRERLGRLSRK